MRTTYLAAALVASTTAAFEFEDMLRVFQMFGSAYETAMNIDMADYTPTITTRHDARRTIEQFKDRRVKPLTKEQRHMATQAHHSIMNRRSRMGLPLVGAAAGPIVGQSYENLSSISGNFLNLLQGMQYNSAGNDSKCYDAA